VTTNLPASWSKTTLGAISDILRGVTYKKDEARSTAEDGYLPLLRATNINGSLILDSNLVFVPRERVSANQVLTEGDILIASSSGSSSVVGKNARLEVPWTGTWGAFCSVLRPTPLIDGKYLAQYLRSSAVRSRWSKLASGTNINNLKVAHIADTEIIIPPLAEQQRIANALEENLSRLDAAENQLRSILRRLGFLRDRLEAAACTGSLDPELRRFLASSTLPPAGVIDENLPPVPDSWQWARLGDLAEVVGGVTKDTNKQSDPNLRLVPYLRVANVQRGRLDLSEITQIRVPERTIDKLTLQLGDVLLNEGGDRDKLGRGWIWEGQIDGCIHQNHVFRARILNSQILPKLLAWHANGYGKRWFEVNGKQSVNLASISLSKMKLFPVPVPPVELQEKLVVIAEAQLSVLNQCETVIRATLKRAVALRAALFNEAFAGRLVEQDPADEAAGLLLERIAVKQAAIQSVKSRRRVAGANRIKATTTQDESTTEGDTRF
jgi:type I restriction enzyme S subunit